MTRESKRAKLERLKNSKTKLQVELAQVATKQQLIGGVADGSLSKFYSYRNPAHNRARGNMDRQIGNLNSKIMGINEKIKKLEHEIYN